MKTTKIKNIIVKFQMGIRGGIIWKREIEIERKHGLFPDIVYFITCMQYLML